MKENVIKKGARMFFVERAVGYFLRLDIEIKKAIIIKTYILLQDKKEKFPNNELGFEMFKKLDLGFKNQGDVIAYFNEMNSFKNITSKVDIDSILVEYFKTLLNSFY